MPTGPLLTYRYLYLSRLAEGLDFATFQPIAVRARARNPAIGISGVLLFDGERFCQLLEGGAVEVRALAQLIQADRRHVELTVLHEAMEPAARLREDWKSGYCESEDLDRFEGPNGLRGPTALSAFAQIAARADLLQ